MNWNFFNFQNGNARPKTIEGLISNTWLRIDSNFLFKQKFQKGGENENSLSKENQNKFLLDMYVK